MIELSQAEFRDWYDHPITRIYFRALTERHDLELKKLVNYSFNEDSSIIERNLFRLMGKSEIVNKLQEFKSLKLLLENLIDWRE